MTDGPTRTPAGAEGHPMSAGKASSLVHVGDPHLATLKRPPGHGGQDCMGPRPWSVAYAAKTSVGVPPV